MNGNTLSGITCTVRDCVYHNTENKCMASSIQVNGENSCCSSCETECATFKPSK